MSIPGDAAASSLHARRILIAGCGDVGLALGRLLTAGANERSGRQVWGLRRSPERFPEDLPEAFHPLAGDLTDRASLKDALEGELRARPELAELDAVVYTAAASGFDDAAYEAAYVSGPRVLIETLAALGLAPRRFLFTSSTGVYGQTDGSWVDETSVTRPTGFSGRRLLEGEAVVLQGPVAARVAKPIVVRFGGIYGPGRTRLLDQVRSGEATCREGDPADPSTIAWTNRIHRDDCAGSLAHLLDLPAPASLYLGVDEEPAPRGEVLDFLAERLGAPRPRRVADTEESPQGRAHRSNKRCSSRRLRESGYGFRFPSFREGYRSV